MILHFQKIGNGQKILLAFHGMGQDFLCFQPFAQAFAHQYTTYLFDLPYHGKSENLYGEHYQPDEAISKMMWQEYLMAFLDAHEIDTFSVIAFSIGGRFGLATLEAFSNRIDQLILIAPDGVTEHPIYYLATRFKFFRNIFKVFNLQQRYFYLLAATLVKLRVVHPNVIKMVAKMLKSPEERTRLYRAWVGYRKLTFKVTHLFDLINQRPDLMVLVFMGKYDKLLPLKSVRPLTDKLGNQRLIVLPTGHGQLVNKVIKFLKNNNN